MVFRMRSALLASIVRCKFIVDAVSLDEFQLGCALQDNLNGINVEVALQGQHRGLVVVK